MFKTTKLTFKLTSHWSWTHIPMLHFTKHMQQERSLILTSFVPNSLADMCTN